MSKEIILKFRNFKGTVKRTGMIEFSNPLEAQEAIKKTGTILDGYYIHVIMSTSAIISPPKEEIMELLEKTKKVTLTKEERLEKTILVTDIDGNLNDNQLIECFGYCGKIEKYFFKKEGSKYVFLKIEFEEKINAECAIHLDQFQLGNKKLTIKKSTELVK